MAGLHQTVLIISHPDAFGADYLSALQPESAFSYKVLRERDDTQIFTLCQSQQIDGILLILENSRSNVCDRLKQLQAQMGQSCPPILVIGHDHIDLAIQVLKAGAVDYLIKARLTADDLCQALQAAIENAQAKSEQHRDVESMRLSKIHLDITERQQAQEALRLSEERYRTLFETMEDGFCTIKVLFDEDNIPIDYRFLEVNPAFAKQTGLKQAEGATARQLLPALEPHWFEIYGKVALTGEPMRFENGSEIMNRWFEVYAFRIDQPEERKVAILFKDISDRKAIELNQVRILEQEQAAREAAEYANRVKDEFLAILSHELRSPLNPILGWTKLLQTRQLDAAKTVQALSTIERNAKLQTQLIDDLLDVARILRGKLKLNNTQVSLTFVIESAIDTVKSAADLKSISLHAELPKMMPMWGDAARLQQIAWNLLSNAIKFTPHGGQVNIQLVQVGDQAQIKVIDTGKGINPNFLPYIFESFRQEDVSITRQFGGLGLGLAIVRHLVEAHGGTVAVDSLGEGQGATFTVKLPLVPADLSHEPVPEGLQEAVDLNGIRILAVDDLADARELLAAIFTQQGAEVMIVAAATDVLANLETFKPDVLINDLGMPDMDGYTLIQKIRALAPEKGGRVPAIALTAYAREEDEQRALSSGYQKHLSKPVDVDKLIQAVASLV